ncbi:MAG TPA: lysylphosphatidylglycerol synthase transmembrane domain-containing protein [Solirubrobacteraceae bacterium]|jgi:hypothetical protein|nr:lysylphosphatidylglycerol synthase transmembrane domain-containing protein [Solirubrobacteraceae bacterium]
MLSRRPRITMLLSVLVAGGTVVGIAASDSPRALWDTLKQIQPEWLAVAFGFELLSYVGYVIAYRSTVVDGRKERLSLMLTVRLVVAGFGPFVPLGGFSFDRQALRSVHSSRREAHRQVLALGVIEYLLLAPAACVCALVLLLESDKASLVLTLPWVFAVPLGFGFGWWATEARVVKRFEGRGGKLRRAIGKVLAEAAVLRGMALRPLERPGALIGMAIYWAAEIACLAYALRCFGVELSVPALVVAYATGYAASRRSLPLGGAGVTEALLTLALITVHVPGAEALLSVVAYRVVNYLVPTLPSLVAHSSVSSMLEDHGGTKAKPGRA